MRSILAGFAIGVVVFHQSPLLPSTAWVLVLGVSGALMAAGSGGRLAMGLIAGTLLALGYTGWHAGHALDYRLPAPLEGETLRVEGEIIGLPRDDGYRSVFLFLPQRFPNALLTHPPRRLRLSWYGAPEGLAAGQRWVLDVRLKRPRGLMNPGAFDYERWLFAQRIDAVGYVRGAVAHGLADSSVDRLRQHLSHRLEALSGPGDASAVLRALAVADRRDIPPELWSVFNATGTGHLLAISGLHIGLAAGMGGLLTAFLWGRSAALCRRVPPRAAGAGVGLLAAAGYALLAGLGLPTQRALVMTGVAACALMLRRGWQPVDVFLWAVAAVLVADPMAPLGAGFWLSFWAVGVLLLVSAASGRGRWVKAQLAVSCGLFPLLALWFAELPWISPLANAVAVPVVSLLVVPTLFLGMGTMAIAEAPAQWLLWTAETVLEALLTGLTWAAARTAMWTVPELPAWALAGAVLGLAMLLIPGRWPGRPLGVGLLLPLVLYQPPALPPGTVRLTFADVGQGAAVIVQTRHHVLIYDTGPRLGRTDGVSTAVLPILRTRGIDRVDRLVVSHADSDHAGGASTLLRSSVAVDDILAGEPLEGIASRPCRQGQSWRWDGVAFSVLHPRGLAAGNDASCVLTIRSAAGSTALLPGDISRGIEQSLVREYGEGLRSDLLMVPHHGSGSSSSRGFVETVDAREAVFTVGYRNRYGLPDDDVVRRYLVAGAAVRETSGTGALSYVMDGELRLEARHRRSAGRYYHDD